MMDVNSGYIGHSMSRRAAEAYEDGEMPKSKWTKKAMVAAIQSYCDEFDMSFDPDVLKGMRKDEVFEQFFHKSSWHHTSKFFNETDFYKLDEDAICESFRPMTQTEVAERDAVRIQDIENRYGFTYDEVYDSWLNESPLPSPAISQQPEKIAVAAGYRFNLVDAREASGIDLKGCGTVVTVDGQDYEIMKGATYEDSRKVDDLLDSHGDKPISDYRKRPQGMSLKQAVREAREASAKLAEENGGTDDPDGKDER